MLKRFKNKNFIIVAFLIGLFLGINMPFVANAVEPAHSYLDYFHRVYQLVKSQYVEEPKTKQLFYGAIKGMLKSLNDPYSRFLDEQGYKELKELSTGKFVGVGIVITIRNGKVVIISPIDDSPAMKAGIKAGDQILKINGTAIHSQKLSSVIKMIKGKKNSKIKFTIKRDGFEEPLHFALSRASIKIKSVAYTVIKSQNVGYIKIKNFAAETTKDTAKALKSFNKQGIKKVIVDLRYNPGGLLTAATGLSDLFLKKGKIIVSTKGRNGLVYKNIFKSKSDPIYRGKLLLLVNRGSASSSEIFSGAMRDNKRAVLLGEKTFGKGVVQKTYTLDKNIGVAITIARYYTPSGEMIHHKGIKPDYVVPADKLSKKDIKALKEIRTKKIIKGFSFKNLKYNKSSKEKFYAYLKSKNIKLSPMLSNYLLKNQIYFYKKSPLYSLEFDKQLKKALEILKK